MKFPKYLLSVVAFAVAVVSFTTAPMAQEPPPAIAVYSVDTNGDTDAFLALVREARGISERLGLNSSARVYSLTFAGPNTGAVTLVVEYPGGFANLASSLARIQADEQYQSVIERFEDAGMTVEALSVAIDITEMGAEEE